MGTHTDGKELSYNKGGAAGVTATGPQTAICLRGEFDLFIGGTFVGTVVLECSPDSGTTWYPVVGPWGAVISITAPCSMRLREPEAGVLYRVNITARASGSITWRLSQ